MNPTTKTLVVTNEICSRMSMIANRLSKTRSARKCTPIAQEDPVRGSSYIPGLGTSTWSAARGPTRPAGDGCRGRSAPAPPLRSAGQPRK
jgi:hypothetical protein